MADGDFTILDGGEVRILDGGELTIYDMGAFHVDGIDGHRS